MSDRENVCLTGGPMKWTRENARRVMATHKAGLRKWYR